MPLTRCGKNGWKWGQSGHCYEGKDAKHKALMQGVAIEGPDKFKKVATADPDLKNVQDNDEEMNYEQQRPFPTLPTSANPNDPPAHASVIANLRKYLRDG